ncbi:ABC transporter ATP-binding protein [Agathobacter rectalis]|uniref:ABC transporter ATP-binding protein n=1 Tax=Agathobacter rectalis TaxID=39491 RepID=A0A412Q2N8_9FIRM|nr:ABC transporter ATP-binding protein [Agathobacter rectalis]RGT75740.1 ABC transporter ATP-binding protein [Agathobacter rectalis]RGT80624.1 ABC transporter ATP-binding protein [Agathobacter rectalis]
MKKSYKLEQKLDKFPFKCSCVENIIMLIMTLISGTCMILQVQAISDFIDNALLFLEKQKLDVDFYNSALLLIFFVTIDWMFPRIISILGQKSELKLKEMYRPLLLEKCAKLKYCYVENSESWDLINRVLKNTEKQWVDIFEAVLSLLQLTIKIIGILFIIAGYVWWAAIFILIFCIPLFILSIKGGKSNYKAQKDTSNLTRRYEYLDKILNEREYIDERKLFGFYKNVDEKYSEAYKKAFRIATKTQIHWAMKTKLSGALSSIAALLIITTLMRPTIKGVISVGLFLSLVNAIFSLTSQMSWELSRNIDILVKGTEFYKDIKWFCRLDEEYGVLELPEYIEDIKTIEFKHVYFRYPGTEIEILKDVSFKMENGKHYALVGQNGAGKTTIIKLLTGLYSEYTGEILINGKELRCYTKAQQKGMFTVVYQDFIRHALTVRENCELANPCGTISEEQIMTLLDKFELSDVVNEYSNGLDTSLGKVKKDSVDFSGGQWQKLAIIRALLGEKKVQILDEPTAALDPKMESEVYELFQEMTDDRMTILISHRLGFAKKVDHIIVFSNGTVLEQGDFVNLMNKQGLFYQMYQEQRSWYE